MYDLLFVRRRRRRKVAALVALFSSIGVTSLVIISFLGRSVGTFTVALSNSEVNLSLSETQNTNKNSTFLRVNENAKYVEHTYAQRRGFSTMNDRSRRPLLLISYATRTVAHSFVTTGVEMKTEPGTT